MPRIRYSLPVIVVAAWLSFDAPPNRVLADPPADLVDFFETNIRPVLVAHCYSCHSAEAEGVSGSLWLDSAAGIREGGDSGPAIEPGESSSSLLISAIRYESMEMPPDGKLPDHVIRDFERWIDAGATDPRDGPAPDRPARSGIDLAEGKKFWAFQPPRASEPPAGDATPAGEEASSAIDRYLAAARQDQSVIANGPASAETRLRRLAFDLTGLPPDADLRRRWLARPTPANWRRIVDELLASPGFAEQWARHWMDVARYADSNGADFNATFHEAWRYRDYLIRSVAGDRPWDRMIRQQIAGDLLPATDEAERHDNLVATTFLMLGTKMLSERNKEQLRMDVVDEQIDTVGRAFMGLTLGCARCHDHKFDPIPTEDYYALAGIFRSTRTLQGESQKYVSTWARTPLPADPAHRAAVREHERVTAECKAEIKEAEEALARARTRRDAASEGIVVDDDQAERTGSWTASTYSKHFIGKHYLHDDNGGKGEASLRYPVTLPRAGRYEVRLSHSPGGNRAADVPVTLATADGERTVRWDQRQATHPPMWSSLGTFDFAQGDTFVTISNAGTQGYVIADAVQFVPVDGVGESDRDGENDRGVEIAGRDDAAGATGPDIEEQIAEIETGLASLRSRLEELQATAPQPLPEAMALADLPTPEIGDARVHIRGEIGNLGEAVPRGFIRVCGDDQASIGDPQASGRRELAEWLTDPDHPLVARVFVNRVWKHLMGQGIVRTVDQFGFQGDRPSHPELLDALAIRFIRGGWRLKPLVRDIVLSDAYQLSSADNPAAAARDPENRLLWRMNRKRLSAESIRDAMVAASGGLDRRSRVDLMRGFGTLVSGNSGGDQADVDDVAEPCRSIYLPVVRGYIPPMLTALDAADPDLIVGDRPTTNVPGQALVLVNSPDIIAWAEDTSRRILAEAEGYEDRLREAYRRLFQREPDRYDRQIADPFFAGGFDDAGRWHEFVAAMFAATEFRWLD